MIFSFSRRGRRSPKVYNTNTKTNIYQSIERSCLQTTSEALAAQQLQFYGKEVDQSTISSSHLATVLQFHVIHVVRFHGTGVLLQSNFKRHPHCIVGAIDGLVTPPIGHHDHIPRVLNKRDQLTVAGVFLQTTATATTTTITITTITTTTTITITTTTITTTTTTTTLIK
jgi:hypothetical protein